MSTRNCLAVLTVAALSAAACGGGDASKEAGAPAAAPATTVAAASAAAPAAGGGGMGTASLAGKISFEGPVPAPEKVKLGADPKCAALHKEGLERAPIKVKDGGLADALVYVKSGISGSYPAPTEPILLDQKGCDYSPHMSVLQTGQPLKIRNSDDTLHNIHPRPQVNAEFNIGQPRQGMESSKSFDKPEVMIPVGCDVHPWMRAYVSVLPHPFFAVTKEDGSYEIKGLPAGEYEIEVLHGRLKGVAQKVTVKDGEASKLDLALKS